MWIFTILAARDGHVEAALQLGLCLYSGVGETVDWLDARHWLAKAAVRGSVVAMNALGSMHSQLASSSLTTRRLHNVSSCWWYLMASERNDAHAKVMFDKMLRRLPYLQDAMKNLKRKCGTHHFSIATWNLRLINGE